MRILPAALAAVICLLATAPLAAANKTGPDWVSSDNVEYIGSLKPDIGVTTGAKIVGNRMFVTSAKNISIYSIKNPASPELLGILPNASWENEEVPTNGKILAFASDFFSAMPNCVSQQDPGDTGAAAVTGRFTGCVQFFDVRDPANIKEIGATPNQNHTAECVLDCQWFYGSGGTIIDARGALDGRVPTEEGNWIRYLRDNEGVDSRSCHHIRELRPGVLLTACRPFSVITVNPEDAAGASPTTPQVLYTGNAAKFVHSARWPREGEDELLLTGGEENFNPQCEQFPPGEPEDRIFGNNSEFSTYSAEAVNEGTSTQFELLDQVGPAGNGTYVDGKPVANHLGCSVHWFQEHSTFKNGGLVALSEYEDGVRFMQIHKDGSIEEQGFFLPLGGSSSSPKWAPSPNGDIVYSIDYDRGIDIIRWRGEHYVPGKGKKTKPEKGKKNGTEGTSATPARLNRRQAARRNRLAAQLRAKGWSPGFCRLAASRG